MTKIIHSPTIYFGGVKIRDDSARYAKHSTIILRYYDILYKLNKIIHHPTIYFGGIKIR